MSDITPILSAITSGSSVRVPSSFLDDQHCLDGSLGLRDASQDRETWWRHVEGNGYTLGIWQDGQGAYWTLEYDPAGDCDTPLKLVFAGNDPAEVGVHLGLGAEDGGTR